MKRRTIFISLIIIVLVGLTTAKLLSNKKAAEDKIYIHDMNDEVLVEVNTPKRHTFSEAFQYLGVFEPIRQNMVSSDTQGKLIKMTFKEGDRVREGQLLAKVDDELLRLQLANAEVQVEGFKNDDKRFTSLIDEQAVPGIQHEKNRLGLRSAEIQLKQLEKQLRSTNLVAPFTGVITKKMVDLGSFIGPGTPIAELTDISTLKLSISVPERDILNFKEGQEVEITSDLYSGRSFRGVVSLVGVQADRVHNFKVQVSIPNTKAELMAGMYGSVRLPNNKRVEALSIPRKALVGSSKDPKVYIVKNGKAVLTSFSAGISDGEYIEVVSGVRESDQVIVKGQINLENMMKVKTK